MRFGSNLRGLTVLRPLLGVNREALSEYLTQQGQTWREDESNDSDQYQRNRLRRILCRWALRAPFEEWCAERPLPPSLNHCVS